MKTQDEVIKMFKAQEGKTAKEVINWYYETLGDDRFAYMQTIHDWELTFEYNKKLLDGKKFAVTYKPCEYVAKQSRVWLRMEMGKHKILLVTTRAQIN